jgi:nicotinate-nucleotide pyrophosphorylase (carboxylating)
MTPSLPDLANDPYVRTVIRRALREDIGNGDATTRALVPLRLKASAEILARTACRVAGGTIAAAIFRELDPGIQCDIGVPDGADAKADDVLLTLRGNAGKLLTAERTALNFMQRMTGIASLTARFVDQVKAYPVKILDTRKTTPTLRLFEKYAVLCGGGTNHRMGLFDMVLLKDNHRFLWRQGGTPDLAAAIRRVRLTHPDLPIEVEVETQADLLAVLPEKPDWIMLDNMSLDDMRACVKLGKGAVQLEASGGVSLERVAAIAATGVDAISIGALTHSAPAADLSLELSA